ncbi:MAG: hypothetical protein HYV63_12365 [Candidatus Schekmanbacteria bacterium]|nr:hypothetical protein [Candidatus Schekmanbacteria bacterium]
MSKGTITARGPVGRRLIQMLRRERGRKVVSFATMAAGAQHARDLQQSAISRDELDKHDPSHGWYVLARHQLSIFIQQTAALRETRCFTDPINDAEDEYMPTGPPMSPLTRSYFFFCSACDLSPKGDGETLASATLDLVREIGTEPHLLAAMDALERSRMGLWVHQGLDGNRVVLRELVTDEEHRCVVPSGYRGRKGEVWLVRVLPPGAPGLHAVVITTPYVLIRTAPAHWLAYLDRALGSCPAEQRRKVYPLLMKYGENPRYWPEYVFAGYVNYQSDVVFLTGLPDIKASQPHSRINS